MKTIKGRGLRKEPCGTPLDLLSVLECTRKGNITAQGQRRSHEVTYARDWKPTRLIYRSPILVIGLTHSFIIIDNVDNSIFTESI